MMDERISQGHYFRRAVTKKQKEGEGINPVQFSPGLWLPTTTNTPQNIPERRNINLKILIKTALSRRQQGFESPTGCQHLYNKNSILKKKCHTYKVSSDARVFWHIRVLSDDNQDGSEHSAVW